MPTNALSPLAGDALLTELQKRAFRFFWEKADLRTGLIHDRAKNGDSGDEYRVASIAATGYGLAALASGVQHGWISRADGLARAKKTLGFIAREMPHQNGWLYHFLDARTGARTWRCEVSSMDTGLLIAGTLACGQFFKNTEVQKLAAHLYDRLDWNWLRTRNGARPQSLLMCHGWKPERGFLTNNWDTYSEGVLLYLLGLGASHAPLSVASWQAWRRDIVTYGGLETLTGGPLFLHQMAHGFFNLRNRRDAQGWNYWASSVGATRINRLYCIDQSAKIKGYGPNGWGLNASDGPRGYRAYAGPGNTGEKDDGTLSPTGAIASLIFTPDLSLAAADAMYRAYGSKLWGRYGFGDAFNVGKNWYDPDVIGIDLGIALVAIENHRTGLFWRLMNSHPAAKRAYQASGLSITHEPEPPPLFRGK